MDVSELNTSKNFAMGHPGAENAALIMKIKLPVILSHVVYIAGKMTRPQIDSTLNIKDY